MLVSGLKFLQEVFGQKGNAFSTEDFLPTSPMELRLYIMILVTFSYLTPQTETMILPLNIPLSQNVKYPIYHVALAYLCP